MEPSVKKLSVQIKIEKMISKPKKSFEVTDIHTNGNFATVCCKIPKFVNVRNFVQIGEYIATSEAFDMNFGGIAAKWKILFYPNGQYDFGFASDDCRLYIKLIECDAVKITVNIETFLIALSSGSPSPSQSVTASASGEYTFITNDGLRNWAGPFSLLLSKRDRQTTDNVMIKCAFKLLSSNENKEAKRSFSDVYSPPASVELPSESSSSKKTRSLSPSADDTDHQVDGSIAIEAMDVDESASPIQSRNPFATKSPMAKYSKLSMGPPANPKEHQGVFKHRKSSRSGIFDKDERDEWKNRENDAKLQKSCEQWSLSRFKTPEKPSSPWKRTQCVTLSDIESNEEADNQGTQAEAKEKCDTSTPETEMLSGGESGGPKNVGDKIKFFENTK